MENNILKKYNLHALKPHAFRTMLFLLLAFSLKTGACNLNLEKQESEPMLKASVFLDNLDYRKENKLNCDFELLALMDEIHTAIKNEKSIIASTSLFKNLMSCRYYLETLMELFSPNIACNYNIFGTKDKSFIILIPNSEHPQIQKAKDLEQDLGNLGLNYEKLCVVRIYNKRVSKENLKKLFENPEEARNKDIEHLRKFFLEDKLDRIQLLPVQV